MFGAALTAEGDRLAVGAPGSREAGTVHLYRRAADGTFENDTVITAPDDGHPLRFGTALDLQGERLAVLDMRNLYLYHLDGNTSEPFARIGLEADGESVSLWRDEVFVGIRGAVLRYVIDDDGNVTGTESYRPMWRHDSDFGHFTEASEGYLFIGSRYDNGAIYLYAPTGH
jgi:hypothetical protein